MVMQGIQGEVLEQLPPGAGVVERVQPSGVRYSTGQIPLAVPAKSSCRKFYPSNGRVFSPASTKVIQLPLAAEGQFLDSAGHSFLRFDLEVSVANATAGSAGANNVVALGGFGAGASSVIRRMRILSATGQQLEDIEDYNALQALMVDLQCDANYVNTHMKSRYGGGQIHPVISSGKISDNGATARVDSFPATDASTTAKKSTRSYSINLMSGLLQQTKYLPLLTTKGGIQIELTLEDPEKAFTDCQAGLGADASIGAGLPTVSYELKNVEYVAELIDFGPEFNMRFAQMLASVDGVKMSGTTFRTHVGSFDPNAGGAANDVTLSVSERARSIKSIFTIMRANTQYNSIKYESIADRTAGGVTGYQYRIGSLTYPDHEVRFNAHEVDHGNSASHATRKDADVVRVQGQGAEALSQAFKATGGALTDIQASSMINPYAFTIGNKINLSQHSVIQRLADRGTSVFAMSFESTTQDTMMLESGLNSASQALPIEVRFKGASPKDSTRVNTYVMCDVIFTFLPNGEVQASL